MRNRQKVFIELRNENRRLRPERCGYVRNPFIVVWVCLLEYVKELCPREIDSLVASVVGHVIHHGRRRITAYNFPRVRIQDNQFGGIPCGDKQRMGSLASLPPFTTYRYLAAES